MAKRIYHLCIMSLMLVVFLCFQSAHGTEIESGIYEELMLAKSQNGHIVGRYFEQQGENPTKTCSFFLVGQSDTNPISILTWSDRVLPGTLYSTNEGISLAIPQGREHVGCGLVLMNQIDSGLMLSRTVKTTWTDLRQITSERTFIFVSPDSSSQTKMYVVKNDVVGVVSQRDDWLKIEYPSVKKMISGWIHLQDTGELSPPPF